MSVRRVAIGPKPPASPQAEAWVRQGDGAGVKDTGDFYASGWQPLAAWQIWDLGRLMANHRSGDLLDQVDKVEASVEKEEPSLF